MGAGIAAILTTMLRESVPGCSEARCYAMACPACMTLELAQSCRDYVTTVINGTDIVPTFSAGEKSFSGLRGDGKSNGKLLSLGSFFSPSKTNGIRHAQLMAQ